MVPNFFVYIAGKGQRDEARIRAFASILGWSAYDAKVVLGAAGPRKVAAHVKQEDAEAQVLGLRQAGILAFSIDKQKFSRLPALLPAARMKEEGDGLVFCFDRFPDLPLPRGSVHAAILGYYTTSTTRTDTLGKRMIRQEISSTSHCRSPFIHLYWGDEHTVLDVRGPKFDSPWLQGGQTLSADEGWERLADRFAGYYKAKLDKTLFRSPDEVTPITAALNVSELQGRGGAGSTSDDTPLALAASRLIVHTLVYGL